jgi:hypothetical protein
MGQELQRPGFQDHYAKAMTGERERRCHTGGATADHQTIDAVAVASDLGDRTFEYRAETAVAEAVDGKPFRFRCGIYATDYRTAAQRRGYGATPPPPRLVAALYGEPRGRSARLPCFGDVSRSGVRNG